MTLMTESTASSMRCEPRWATPRTPDRPTVGTEICWVAEQLGRELMPWQRQVAMVGGELVVDEEVSSMLGREVMSPAYPEVVVTVERQTGKTVLVFSWQFQRAGMWRGFDAEPQQVAYTAQDGSAARKKVRNDVIPLLRKSKRLWPQVENIRYAAEDMCLEFVNGARLSVWATSLSAGHGSTIDLGVLDEIFDDEDDRREQAMIPAMATRHDRQKLIASTAEDERGVVLRRKRRIGRQAVDQGRRSGVAYFEWSADPTDDPESPETWRRCHPALGHTITERTIQTALEEMRGEDGSLTEFSRAWLNIPVEPAIGGSEGVWPAGMWAAVCEPAPASGPPAALAIDVALENQWGALAAASSDRVVKLLEHRPGPDMGWLVEAANKASTEFGLPITLQGNGPAGHLARRLDRPRPLEFTAVVEACADFDTAVIEQMVTVRAADALDAAVKGAGRKPVSDRWVWNRRTADVTPLMAASLAFSSAMTGQPYAGDVFTDLDEYDMED